MLNEAYFSWIQQNARDHDSKWLLYHLGRPGEVMRLGWIGGEVVQFVRIVRKIFPMFELTLDGLTEAVDVLRGTRPNAPL